MRRLPRLPTASAAGFVPSQVPCGAFRAPAAAAIAATSGSTPRLNKNTTRQTRRYLSTTPLRPAQPQQSQLETFADEFDEDLADYEAPEIATPLVYPQSITVAPLADDVSDPAYKPAETALELEEVGGLADWWEQPTHWGSEGGVAEYVRSVVRPFGPAEKVTDPAMLEVLAKRAIVEALVVAQYAAGKKRKAVDRLFERAGGMDGLADVVKAEVVADASTGEAAIKDVADGRRVWKMLKTAVAKARSQQPAQQQAVEGEEPVAEAEAVVPETEVEAASPIPEVTPELAQSWIETWDKGWKQAQLRDPVVKFYAAKRVYQLTGHRIPDGKLVSTVTVGDFVKQLLEPPRPKKLAELVQSKAVFEGLPNVRVFPRRVTPIDKEKMVGRWKIIVKELEKRELPVIGLGNESAAIEKKWVSGKA